jgi:YggT family protein
VISEQNAALQILCVVLTVYWWILLAYVLVSWAFLFGMRRPYAGPGRVVLDALDALVLPVVRPLGRLIPPVRIGAMGFDLSIILAFVILWVLRVALGC